MHPRCMKKRKDSPRCTMPVVPHTIMHTMPHTAMHTMLNTAMNNVQHFLACNSTNACCPLAQFHSECSCKYSFLETVFRCDSSYPCQWISQSVIDQQNLS